MSRLFRIAAVAAVVFAIGSVSTWAAMRAVRQVRPFYKQAMAHDPHLLEQGRRELQTQVGAFYSDAKQTGDWSAVFTAAQLNGWLATELPAKYPGMVPADVRDPRIAIDPTALRLGFHSRQLGMETVVTVDTQLFLTDAGELAARLTSVRAGALPLPAAQVAEEVRRASQNWSLPIRWSQVDGEVVALVDVAGAVSSDDRRVVIHALELREDELFIAGQTVDPGTLLENVPMAHLPDEVQSGDHSSRQ